MRTLLSTRAAAAAALSTALISTPLIGTRSAAVASPVAPRPMTSSALLQLEEVRGAGLAVDSGQVDATGSELLGDAGRFDEGCLGEKTMRNITGSKAYPTRGGARAYFDATWTSTTDKDVWLREAIAEGQDARRTDRYVALLRSEIDLVRTCEQDPAQGHHYGPARTLRRGSATATVFLDHTHDGRTPGGGVAIVRDGNRFGLVDLLAGRGRSGSALGRLAAAAAAALR
jgi:hypothetical protein